MKTSLTPTEIEYAHKLNDTQVIYFIFGRALPSLSSVMDTYRRLISFLRNSDSFEDRKSSTYDLVARLPALKNTACKWITDSKWMPVFEIDSISGTSVIRYTYLFKDSRPDGIIRLEHKQHVRLFFPQSAEQQVALARKNYRNFYEGAIATTTGGNIDSLPPGINQATKEIGFLSASSLVLTYDRSSLYISLKDFINKNGYLQSKHVSWLISRFIQFLWFCQKSNTVCYPNCLDDLYINPDHHALLVIGGFEYGVDDKGQFLVPSVYAKRPSVRATKSISLIDIGEVFKKILLQAMGVDDIAKTDFPDSIKSWLYSTFDKDALKTMSSWEKARDEGYPSRFIVLPYERPY